MRSDPVETIEHNGLKISIYHDEGAESPREWDNFGTMVCNHRRYKLGDIHNGSMDDVPEDSIQLALTLYDHSGISMSTSNSSYPFNCPWDAGQVGVIYVTRQKALAEMGAKRLTKKVKQKAIEIMQAEVKIYDQFIRGECYGYVITDDEGNDLDSCWGFIGMEYAIEEAKSACEHVAKSSLAYSI